MSKWTLQRYQKICRESNDEIVAEYAGMLHDDMLWYDLASSMLEHEDGLYEFIRDRIGAEDVKGCLADDLAYPGNAMGYVLFQEKKEK